MTRVNELHTQWMQDLEYQAAYDKPEGGFALASALIEARASAGITQEELARRMETTQSAVARLEGGRSQPSTRTLEKIAKATGTRLKISFEPNKLLKAP
ncbi:MAG TPA: helix-turn-helix transcriptional regulator [Candidatus Competibacteraceae bacterium]|nr:helix-turn-helix transcriptional regulator [Candidatus Competibacteraceae bacterium]MCP5133126.1 helix-turn-helix transcriptional regulator [Gammaproteobacteria bacterium]HPF59795.1 helix-turn-helix transcriptional regulator [Candidatus Competibacteraceae bacterium]